MGCACAACAACAGLLRECGPEVFPLYRKKLSWQGWAGVTSVAERAYRSAHGPRGGKLPGYRGGPSRSTSGGHSEGIEQ